MAQVVDKSESTDARSIPEQRASCCSIMVFSWLNPLLRKGSLQPLTQNDIPSYPQDDDAYECYKRFEKLYQDAITPEKLQEIKKKPDGKRPFGQILSATVKFVGFRFVYATMLYLIFTTFYVFAACKTLI